tara:strand:+ start:309 stop:482 length:174 start_codon:yes stop_codon:yes gene_type:complete
LRIALEEIVGLIAMIVVSQIFGPGIEIAGCEKRIFKSAPANVRTKWEWLGYKLAGDS